ncbi:MAG TPA: ankyrin repeat domain-containing protein [Salinisphaeraceae bacterium]|nr:ankyrin repeat domain-containing protein [Salinisphaeraceae bacterium]
MPLNCPQNSDRLRLPSTGRRPPQPRRWQARLLIACLLGALVLSAGLYALLQQRSAVTEAPNTSDETAPVTTPGQAQDQAQDQSTPAVAETQAPEIETATVTPFCERDLTQLHPYAVGMAELQAAGGLVHLLARAEAAPPYVCAALYLSQGLSIDAVGADGLTALHYAIRANQPAMVQFVLDHGADLHQRAGARQLKPMSYAYYLALRDANDKRNRIIAILNAALERELAE